MNVRCKANRNFRTRMKEYVNDKINEIETKSKNKNVRDFYRGINELKKGYQPRTNFMLHKILIVIKEYSIFFLLLIIFVTFFVQCVNGVVHWNNYYYYLVF
jgi:hypothetical protein